MNHYENVKALAANDSKAELKIDRMKQGKSVESVCHEKNYYENGKALAADDARTKLKKMKMGKSVESVCHEMNHYESVKTLAADDAKAKPKMGKTVESGCLAHCSFDEMGKASVSTTGDGAAETKDEEMEQNEVNYYYVRQWRCWKYLKYAFITVAIIAVVVFIILIAMPFKKDSVRPDVKLTDTPMDFHGKLVVLANKTQLYMFDRKTKTSTVIFDTNSSSVVSFDVHTDRRIYWMDWVDDYMKTTRLTAFVDERPNVLFVDPRFRPQYMALDRTSGNLYVCDFAPGKLVVVNTSTGDYTLLMSDLGFVLDLALDPEEGLIFMSDLSRGGEIIRARMDGTQRTTVISNSYANVGSPTVDLAHKRLYWTYMHWDTHSWHILSSNYDGNDRRFFFKTDYYVCNIAIVDDRLYWMRFGDDHPLIILFSCEISANHTCEHYANHTTTISIWGCPTAKGYSSTRGTSMLNPCEVDNGGCQQLCLRAGRNARSCACRVGWQMNPDKRSCREVREFLVYLRDREVRVDSVDGATKDLVWPTPCSIESIVTKGEIDFDYDLRNDHFYWCDDRHIYRIKLRKFDNIRTTILSVNEPNVTLLNIAYDWYTGNMYFVQRRSDGHQLMMFNVNLGEQHQNTLMTYYYNEGTSIHACPYALRLHPAEHSMFYACWSFIQRATMNNTSIDKIHSSFPEFKQEYRLVAVDYTGNRVYWISDSGLATIVKHSNLDGSDVRAISVTGARNGRTIDVHENWLYVGNSTGIWRVDKKTGRGAVQIVDGRNSGFKVFSERVHFRDGGNKCAEGNGGCEQFCLSGGDGPVCMCEDYMVARGFTCSRD